jgi:hypothetical protein
MPEFGFRTGQPLDGSKHDYTPTFATGQYPPVNAFGSVTMYNGKTQLLMKKAIDRDVINSPMLPGLTKNEDGSLMLSHSKKLAGEAKGIQLASCPRMDPST